MAKITHLVKRFFGSVVPRAPKDGDDAWAEGFLLAGEVELWRRMPKNDRRHAVGVAREVARTLGDRGERPVVAAALLHDVGKIDSGLGTYGRVIATLSAAAVRHDQDVIRDWSRTRGITRRVGLYLMHPKLGGDMLALAGSDPLTEAWAREHHLPDAQWTVEPAIAHALKDADDD